MILSRGNIVNVKNPAVAGFLFNYSQLKYLNSIVTQQYPFLQLS